MEMEVNYGTLNFPIGESPTPTVKEIVQRSQVFQATHNRAGEHLPLFRRSFISFSFGGRDIEDFDLIACCDGDTMSRSGSAEFEDLVTSYDIMDGQYYHGTHFKPNTLSLRLVTDGIDEKKLNDFYHWFQGGRTRELILAEHPNRAIMARVSSPPKMEMLPYEKNITVTLGGKSYNTSTTLYKGFILLDLTADTPFWYAKQNILFKNVNSEDTFNGISIYTNSNVLKDALKVMYEDMVPSIELVMSTMHFGGNQYALIGENAPYSLIVGYLSEPPTLEPMNWAELSLEKGYYRWLNPTLNAYWYVKGAFIEGMKDGVQYYGRIAGPTAGDEGGKNEVLYSSEYYDFFYGGTAPSPTILSFNLSFNSLNENGYISAIANTYAPNSSGDAYSTITIESRHKKTFDFTTPNIMSSWNKALKVYNDIIVDTTTWGDLTDTLRDQIRHPAVRTWCVKSVSYLTANNTNNIYLNADTGAFTENGKNQLITLLSTFFGGATAWNAHFEFNSDTQVAEGTFKYWKAANSEDNVVSLALNNTNPAINFTEHTENVGDMLRSNWLFLEDRNEFNSDGMVAAWTSATPQYAHRLTHNLDVALKSMRLKYKNMYL